MGYIILTPYKEYWTRSEVLTVFKFSKLYQGIDFNKLCLTVTYTTMGITK